MVVDVLRATTAICAAFQAGVESIVPLDTLEALADYRTKGYLCAAERGGRKVQEAEYGNSPTEYMSSDLHGQHLAYSTTNGTVALLLGADADTTLVGCFSNIDTLAQRLQTDPHDLVILCSGWKYEPNLEDTLFAGALCHQLMANGLYTSQHDAVQMAVSLWKNCKGDPYNYCLAHASHVQRLIGFGAKRDVGFAFIQNTCPVLPRLVMRNKTYELRCK